MTTRVLYQRAPDERVNWLGSIPFFLMHLMPLGILLFGITWQDVVLCIALYVVRMFFITAAYHRYFGHRAYKMGRVMQFLMAVGGSTAAQKGVLWWAGHHRHHHKYSDMPEDIHSPRRGFWWSHVGWILCKKYDATPMSAIKDFAKYPELRWLNRWHLLPAIALGAACLLIGGPSALFGGFFLSTVLLYHGTFSINSFTHLFGQPALRHHGHQPKQLAARPRHLGRGLAQQSPLLSVDRQPGLLLVGDRHLLLRAEGHELVRPGARAAQAAATRAGRQSRERGGAGPRAAVATATGTAGSVTPRRAPTGLAPGRHALAQPGNSSRMARARNSKMCRSWRFTNTPLTARPSGPKGTA